jgi:DNA (cytosine-5)-methyltransferase 1
MQTDHTVIRSVELGEPVAIRDRIRMEMNFDLRDHCKEETVSQDALAKSDDVTGFVNIDVYDFFSGCGGTSAGLRRAGLSPKIAVDFDEGALATYSANFPEAAAILDDIRYLATSSIEKYFERDRKNPVLMCACAPCQPFSKQNRHKSPTDERKGLLGSFGRFITRFSPELLLIENVPGIKADADSNPLFDLLELLDDLGYHYDYDVVMAHDYGVPQSRRRLLLVASLLGPIGLPAPTHGDGLRPHLTVRDAIEAFPPLAAGQSHEHVENHQAARLSPTNLERIRASRAGGSWNDWPYELRLPCHADVAGYTDVYGRMNWDRPAPALTTRCVSYSNGRFGHPVQDRAISVREAAALQTFDHSFKFIGNLASMSKQIGNAVPTRLAEAFGHMFKKHVLNHPWDKHGEN